MSTGRKILNLIIALVLLVSGILIFFMGTSMLSVIALILFVMLVAIGIRELVYFFTMARYMVGGRMILYIGILILDAAFFALSIFNDSPVIIMIYLIIAYAVSGVFDILHAMEEKRMGDPAWKRTLAFAIGNLVIAVACGVFIKSPDIAVLVFAGGLIYAAIMRIVSTFKRNAVIYIAQ